MRLLKQQSSVYHVHDKNHVTTVSRTEDSITRVKIYVKMSDVRLRAAGITNHPPSIPQRLVESSN